MTRRPKVGFVVNGGRSSAMAERAESFAARLSDRYHCTLIYREGGKIGAVGRILTALAHVAPDLTYVLDLGVSGVSAAGIYKHATGAPFIVDTGDAVVELSRVLGRGPFGIAATRAMEDYALRTASAVVVRGTYHKNLLRRRGVRASFIPDGVVVDQFAAKKQPRAAVSQCLVIGLIGSSVWIPSRQTCYGWELVELLRLLKGRLPIPVRGVLIGGGSGVEVLKRRCAEYQIEDSIEFAGWIPYSELPARLRSFDICLSTQTNDVIGNVRTTGKLPLYLAAGRFVLASRVGEAARLLPDEMLVDFAGEVDPDYPSKLGRRVQDLVAQRADFTYRLECESLARKHFEYDHLAERVQFVVDAVISRSVFG